jgi:hypothetical protein
MPYQEEPIPSSNGMDTPPPVTKKRRFIRGEKIGPAFWTVASLVSMAVNLVLLVVLIALGRQLFLLKDVVQNQVLGGLYTNFQLMDQAHIRTTIPINTEVPAKFDLPLNTETNVVLTQDVRINNATLYNLNAGPLVISQARLDIVLPAGTQLPVALNLVVPVDQKIPVNLVVDIDIPLEQTELHSPFVGLQDVVKPYYTLLSELPDTWSVAVCGTEPNDLCEQIVP